MNNLDLFLSGDSDEPPTELKVMHETKPDTELCPFFSKTACCRFADECSRNHQYPGISKVYPFHKLNFAIMKTLFLTIGNPVGLEIIICIFYLIHTATIVCFE